MKRSKLLWMAGLVLLLVLGMASQAWSSDAVIGVKMEIFGRDGRVLQPTDSLIKGEEFYLDISLNCNGAAVNEYIMGYSICVDYRGCRGFLERVTSDGNPPTDSNQFTELTTGVGKIVNGVPVVSPLEFSNTNSLIIAANVNVTGKLINSVLNNSYGPFIRYYFKVKEDLDVYKLEFIISRTDIPTLTGAFTQTVFYGRVEGSSDSFYYEFQEINIPAYPLISYYAVSFESNGGSSTGRQIIVGGEKVIKPADPAREGYIFAGWYSDASLTAAYDFDTPISADLVLYAKWNIIPFSAYFNAPAKIYVREGKKVDYVVSVSNIGGDGSNLFMIEADFDTKYLNYEGYTFALDAMVYSPVQTDFTYDVGGKLSFSMVLGRPGVLLKPAAEASLLTFHFSLKDSVVPMKTIIESFLSKVTAAVFDDGKPTLIDAVVVKPGAPVAVLIDPLGFEGGELDEATISWLIYHHLYKTDAADDWDDIKKYDLNGNNMIDLADIVALWSLIGK
ncbi:MAG: InlB B-repeat-containing protein [Clostridiales bacterium]|jgi:uncharacterized repeat protein (TIGR02543 family)|nr:InlB B-repeat-containing protein [Clostridiales bacterium]